MHDEDGIGQRPHAAGAERRQPAVGAGRLVHPYRPGDIASAVDYVTGRLPVLAVPAPDQLTEYLNARLDRKRNLFDSQSVRDLLVRGLIVTPPYKVTSGQAGVDAGPLVGTSPGAAPGALANWVGQGKRVLLLGEPGIGKTTSGMIAAAAALGAVAPGRTVLFVSLRDVAVPPGSSAEKLADSLVRGALGDLYERAPWPGPLPSDLDLVVDGLDEALLAVADAVPLVGALADRGPLLITCRLADFERALREISTAFDVIVRLEPWGENERAEFSAALRAVGREGAAAYVDRHGQREPELLSRPLWLACAAYAYEQGRLGESQPLDDYALLFQCGEALAEEERSRSGLAAGVQLADWWARTAWEENRTGRAQRAVTVGELLDAAQVPNEERLRKAVQSQLDIQGGIVRGFHHDVFRDFWLARRIVTAVADPSVPPDHIGSLLRPQRTPVANKLVRAGLRQQPAIEATAARLRTAFGLSDDTWARNQILYLLGRIDRSAVTRVFLAEQWNDPSLELFVRYSAGWAGALAGDAEIEAAFYSELQSNPKLDEMNRAYHRVYYDDSHVERVNVPRVDDGGPAGNAVHQLVERIKAHEPQHLALRRVELFTLLRFGQTRGGYGHLAEQVRGALALAPAALPEQQADVGHLIEEIRALG